MKHILLKCLSIMAMAAMLSACVTSRNIPQGEYLLNKVFIDNDGGDVTHAEYKDQVVQQPNERILGVRYPLIRYNLLNPEKAAAKLSTRKMYEAPVIWNSSKNEETKEAITALLASKGYYFSKVSDTIRYHRRKADVTYRIVPGKPYKIGEVYYEIKDRGLIPAIMKDTLNSYLHTGDRLDHEILSDERQRMATSLRDQGYYAFTEDYVHFEVDTFQNEMRSDLYVMVEQVTRQDSAGLTLIHPHNRFFLDTVTVTLRPSSGLELNHTEEHRGIEFLTSVSPQFKPEALARYINMHKSDAYSISSETETYQNLSRLNSFNLVNMSYRPVRTVDTTSNTDRFLRADISLSSFKKHQLTADLHGTYAKGDPGGLLILNYRNIGLFRKGETLRVTSRLAMERLESRQSGMFSHTKEYGIETALTIPGLLLPGGRGRVYHGNIPATVVDVGFNFLQRPEYRRQLSSASLSYSWSHPGISHSLKPLDFYYIDSEMSDTYRSLISGMYIESSYIPHSALGAAYSLQITNQHKNHPHWYYTMNIGAESAGALLSAITSGAGTDADGYRHFLGQPYAQYLRGEFDFRLHHKIDSFDKLEMVYRFFAGVGHPYNNSISMPFEKRFYAGGAYGIRGWRVYSLGPGSYKGAGDSYTSNGDIHLEMNVESRFKLFWVMQGALFADIGNIWDAKTDPLRPGADFQWNRFAKELAMSVGAGLRFDFSFFVGRFDVGVKMYDPSDGYLWHGEKNDDLVMLNFGIGYPF